MIFREHPAVASRTKHTGCPTSETNFAGGSCRDVIFNIASSCHARQFVKKTAHRASNQRAQRQHRRSATIAGEPMSPTPTAAIAMNSTTTTADLPPIPARTVWFMAISTGLVVANIYYAQPLLAEIARQFSLSVTQAGALGMLLFVPQGDTRERRSFIIALLLASTVSLLLFATAPNVIWRTLASLAAGATASIVHESCPSPRISHQLVNAGAHFGWR